MGFRCYLSCNRSIVQSFIKCRTISWFPFRLFIATISFVDQCIGVRVRAFVCVCLCGGVMIALCALQLFELLPLSHKIAPNWQRSTLQLSYFFSHFKSASKRYIRFLCMKEFKAIDMKVATAFRFGSSCWMGKYVCVCKLHVFWCGKLCYSWKLKMCLCDDITNDILEHWFDRICTPFAFVFRCWITISFHTSGVRLRLRKRMSVSVWIRSLFV